MQSVINQIFDPKKHFPEGSAFDIKAVPIAIYRKKTNGIAKTPIRKRIIEYPN